MAASDKLTVFISYSRSDLALADALVEALEEKAFQVTIDRRDLPYGYKWQTVLYEFIRDCDTVVFLVSEKSAASKWVSWELQQVTSLNKRLVPVMLDRQAYEDLPPAIAAIELMPKSGVFSLDQHLDSLVDTLNSDRDWVLQHTALAARERDWIEADRAAAYLLRGGALSAAEQWVARQPAKETISEQALALILASRQGATRRQRWAIAGALAVAATATGLATVAKLQRDAALITESRFLATAANDLREEGHPAKAISAALEGLPVQSFGLNDRPLVEKTLAALKNARYSRRLIRRVAPSEMGVAYDNGGGDGQRLDALINGKSLLIQGVGMARLDVDSGQFEPFYAYDAPETRVSANSSSLAMRTSLAPSAILLWSAEKDDTPRKIPGDFKSIDVSSDGALVIAAKADGGAALFDVNSGDPLEQIEAGDGEIHNAVFGKSSNLVALAESGALRILDRTTGRDLARFDPLQGAPRKTYSSGGVSFSDPPSIRSLRFAADDKFILVEQENGFVHSWDWASQKRAFLITDPIFAIAPDGTTAVTAQSEMVSVRDLERSVVAQEFRAHDVAISHLRLGSTDDRLLTIAKDHSVRLWHIDTMGPVMLGDFRHERAVVDAALIAEGSAVATLDQEGYLYIWSAETTVEAIPIRSETFAYAQRSSTGVTLENLGGEPKARLIFEQSDDDIAVYQVQNDKDGSKLFNFPSVADQTVVAAYPSNPPLLLRSGEASIAVFEAENDKKLFELPIPFGELAQASFIADGEILMTQKNEELARLWHVRTGEDLGEVACPFQNLAQLAISRDQRFAAAAAPNQPICVWNIPEHKIAWSLSGHDGTPLLDFAPNGEWLSSGSNDLTARLWDMTTGEEKARTRANGPVLSLNASPNGEAVAILDATIMRLWDPETYQLLAAFQHGVQNPLGAAFSRDGELVLVIGEYEQRIFPVWPNSADLIGRSRDLAARIAPLDGEDLCQLNLTDCPLQ